MRAIKLKSIFLLTRKMINRTRKDAIKKAITPVRLLLKTILKIGIVDRTYQIFLDLPM
tara:strand:+ start:52 stop:225 length:174 start_codon:yes stop_codon:yes gene_type:complete